MNTIHNAALLLSLSFVSAATYAANDYQVNDSSTAISIDVNGDPNIGIRFFTSERNAILVGLGYRNSQDQNTNVNSFSSNPGPGENIITFVNTYTTKRTDFRLYGGIRHNYPVKKITLFVDSIIELIYRDETTTQDNLRVESNPPRETLSTNDKSLDGLGGALRLNFGGEYFFSPQFSIEGKFSARFEYVKVEGQSIDDNNISVDISETDRINNIYTSGVSINYYW
ncbi:MAG: hypothetical protein ACC707_10795 [Thiohalomonadales bacterium]